VNASLLINWPAEILWEAILFSLEDPEAEKPLDISVWLQDKRDLTLSLTLLIRERATNIRLIKHVDRQNSINGCKFKLLTCLC